MLVLQARFNIVQAVLLVLIVQHLSLVTTSSSASSPSLQINLTDVIFSSPNLSTTNVNIVADFILITSTSIQRIQVEPVQSNANLSLLYFGTISFDIENQPDTEILAIIARMQMTFTDSPLAGYANLYASTNFTWNPTDTSSMINASLIGLSGTLSMNFFRQCTDANGYGFTCDTVCTPMNTLSQCYNCDVNGQPVCCISADIDPSTCLNTSSPAFSTTTTSILPAQVATKESNEDLYFWLLVGMSCLCLIVLIAAVIAFCAALVYFRKAHNPKYSQRINQRYPVVATIETAPSSPTRSTYPPPSTLPPPSRTFRPINAQPINGGLLSLSNSTDSLSPSRRPVTFV